MGSECHGDRNTEASLPRQRCGRRHTGVRGLRCIQPHSFKRSHCHKMTCVQKCSLLHAQRNIVSHSLLEIVYFLLPFRMDPGRAVGGGGSNPGSARGRQWEKTISTCEFVLNLGPPKNLPLCYFYPLKVRCSRPTLRECPPLLKITKKDQKIHFNRFILRDTGHVSQVASISRALCVCSSFCFIADLTSVILGLRILNLPDSSVLFVFNVLTVREWGNICDRASKERGPLCFF